MEQPRSGLQSQDGRLIPSVVFPLTINVYKTRYHRTQTLLHGVRSGITVCEQETFVYHPSDRDFHMDSHGIGLPHPSMNWDAPCLTDTWNKFEQHVNLMFSGPLSDKTQAQQVSYLLLWVGEKGRDIHSTFTFAPGRPAVPATEDVAALPVIPAENRNDLQTVCHKFREYVTRKSNVIFARYKFYNRTQGPSETVNECQFHD